MNDPEDMVEIDGRPLHAHPRGHRTPRPAAPEGPAWKSVWFQCCHVYGRINRNRDHTKYEGRCPRCGANVHALIGADGTTRRIFHAH